MFNYGFMICHDFSDGLDNSPEVSICDRQTICKKKFVKKTPENESQV